MNDETARHSSQPADEQPYVGPCERTCDGAGVQQLMKLDDKAGTHTPGNPCQEEIRMQNGPCPPLKDQHIGSLTTKKTDGMHNASTPEPVHTVEHTHVAAVRQPCKGSTD